MAHPEAWKSDLVYMQRTEEIGKPLQKDERVSPTTVDKKSKSLISLGGAIRFPGGLADFDGYDDVVVFCPAYRTEIQGSG